MDPITLSEDDWGVQSHPHDSFGFHYHSQKVIGSLQILIVKFDQLLFSDPINFRSGKLWLFERGSRIQLYMEL